MAKTKSKNVNDVEKELSKLTNTLDKLTKSIEPILNFRDIGSSIEKLKTIIPDNIENSSEDNKPTVNNSTDPLVDSIIELIESTPNDAELGAKIREFYNSYTDDSDDTEE